METLTELARLALSFAVMVGGIEQVEPRHVESHDMSWLYLQT
ncbi:MAG: hypothetical protein Q7R39_00745 [Dehalococcoidia bacterium]|nr:hypothetical protein [Dehalococcoidia bacterium]